MGILMPVLAEVAVVVPMGSDVLEQHVGHDSMRPLMSEFQRFQANIHSV